LNKKNNIFICPLEWGLGHAGRMVPVAKKLRDMGNNIFIGAGEKHLAFFRNEVPGITYINFAGFSPWYSRFLPQYLVLLFQTPLLLYHIILEHNRIKKIIQEYSIDIIISDNRFGLWNKSVKTVYVTHMPLIPLPKAFHFLEFIGVIVHRAIIRKYSLCFIPDLPGEMNISGRLSHNVILPGNTRFIGILSRFTDLKATVNENPVSFKHNTVILSGPEPQRKILEQKLTDTLKDKEPPTVILGGNPEKPPGMARLSNIICFNHLPSSAMKEVITGSESLIGRAGYSTIMELISLNCSALLIPTPGQTEQEYLADNLAKKGWFTIISQKNISSDLCLIPKESKWSKEIIIQSKELLDKALKEMSEEQQDK